MQQYIELLDESVTRGQLRPKSWKWFRTVELERLVIRREKASRLWRRGNHDLLRGASLWHAYMEARAAVSVEIKRTRRQQWRLFVERMASSPVDEMISTLKRLRRGS